MVNFPGSLDTTGSGTLPSNHVDGIIETIHANNINDHSVAIVATETKIGSGSSTPSTNTYLTGTGTGTSAWVPLTVGGVFAARDYGATGNGTTDDTVAVQAAIDAAAAGGGGSILFAPGTYSISQITIPAVEIQLTGNGAATLKHRGTAGTSMIVNVTSTTCPQFTIEDLTIDGNKGTYSASTGGGGTGTGTVYTGGQPESTVTITLTFGNGATFRNCRFINSRHHAMDILGAGQRVLVENCTFTNMAEWGGTTGTDCTPLRFNGTANIYDAVVAFCSFEHPTPQHAGYNPGGVIVDVQGSNLPVRLNVDTCRFKNIGMFVSGTTVGNVYIYRAAQGSSINNCIFETPYFTCIAVENSSDFIIQGNRAFTDANLNSHVFSMQGNERSNNVQQFRVQFVNNTCSGAVGNLSEGIYIDAGGTAGLYPATDVVVADNTFQNCRIGVRVSNTQGVIDIHDNLFRDLLESGYGRALWINGSLTPCLGTINFHHNYVENTIGNAVGCDDVANAGLSIRVENNTFRNTANNDAGLQIRGCDEAIIRGNKWLGTPTSGSIITLGGTNSAGRVFINDNIAATLNTITRTLATSVVSTGNSWQSVGDHPYRTVSGTASATTADVNGFITADATSASFTLTLVAANSLISGSEITVKQINTNANVVSVAPSGSDTIDSFNSALALSPFVSTTFVTNGSTAWYIK